MEPRLERPLKCLCLDMFTLVYSSAVHFATRGLHSPLFLPLDLICLEIHAGC
jgi:hypothetical protein